MVLISTENFEDRKKSIQHFHSLIDKRIENLENALEEGMTTSEYIKQLYGEIPTITSMMSIDPNLLGSKFAQDVVQDSEKATTHAYGSHFPGSYVNSIGDFSPQSYSKVDVLATASWNSIQDVTPSGWTPENSYEYVDSVSDVVTPGQESDVFKDTLFGEVTVNGVDLVYQRETMKILVKKTLLILLIYKHCFLELLFLQQILCLEKQIVKTLWKLLCSSGLLNRLKSGKKSHLIIPLHLQKLKRMTI